MSKRTMWRFFACIVAMAVLAIVPSGAQSERPKNICKAVHLGTRDVAVSCLDGADPTVKGNTSGFLIVSCGK